MNHFNCITILSLFTLAAAGCNSAITPAQASPGAEGVDRTEAVPTGSFSALRKKPLAIVYGGPGTLLGPGDTLESALIAAQEAGFETKVITEPVDEATLARARLWVQPGGPNLAADEHMNANGLTLQVREFVRQGGGYVGFCGGAFSAVNNLHLVQGSAWNLGSPTVPAKLPINWQGRTRYLHFEYGPYIQLEDPNFEVIANYPNGEVAAVRGHFGKGEVFITGVHPEAGPGWNPMEDPDGLDHDLAIGMMREVAGLQ
jgi:hypothetical protein